jgi:hypothetical protein
LAPKLTDDRGAEGHQTEPARFTGLPVVRGARGDRQTGECGRVAQIQNAVQRISRHYGHIAETHKDEFRRQMCHGQMGAHN